MKEKYTTFTEMPFDKVVSNVISTENSYLFTGTGITRAYDPNIGDYEELQKQLTNKKPYLTDYFTEGSYNFEDALKEIDKITDVLCNINRIEASKAAEKYNINSSDKEIIAKHVALLNNDKEELKNFLIEAITKNHPENIHKVDVLDKKLSYFASFLSLFKYYGTINYDILPYWAGIKYGITNFNDGFSSGDNKVYWRKNHNQNFFYFHGAINYFKLKGKIFKAKANEDKSIKNIIIEMMHNKFYPFFIAEGSNSKKCSSLENSEYFKYAINNLKQFDGVFVIFGASLDERDSHIYKHIFNTKKETIYVGLFKNQETKEFNKIELNRLAKYYNKIKSKKPNLFIFDTSQAHIWSRQVGNHIDERNQNEIIRNTNISGITLDEAKKSVAEERQKCPTCQQFLNKKSNDLYN